MAPTARTINYDALLASTMDKFRDKFTDNITLGNPFIAWLQMQGRADTLDGGANILEPVMYQKNSTIRSYSGYDPLDTAAQDGMTVAIYPWRHIAGTISINGEEEAKNSGDAAVIKLLSAKIDQANLSMKEEMNRQAFLDGTGNGGKDMFGLNLLVEDGTAWLSSVAGIDRTVETWWRNQWIATVGSFATNGLDKMRSLYNSCSKGNEHPDLVLSTQAIFEYYEKVLAANERFLDTSVGDAGFQNLLFKAAVFMYDAYSSSGDLFMLNSHFLKLTTHSRFNMATGKFIEPVNQDSRVAKIIWRGNLTMSCAPRQGRMGGITA